MANQESRQQWSSKMGFILSAVGSAVGLGNIWRFPYVLYKNGGGAFLIPYFIAVFTAAIPLLILEYILGNKLRGSTPLSLARAKKGFEWIGWLPSFIAGFIVLYYSSILSWAGNYFVFSFTRAWGSDPNDFFFNKFLKLSEGPMQFGGINFSILIGLLIMWGVSYFICSASVDKGIEAANKILLPLMFGIIIIIVIRGATLPGAAIGLNALFTPDWGKMMDPQVWLAAYGQVFFSLSVAMGIMITYSSYLPKNSDLVNTSFIAGLANSGFEFTASIAVFGILGYMSQSQGLPIDQVVKSGVGLAFVAFPEGINMMGGFGSIVGLLFFACLVFAGLTSFISLLEAFAAPFIEKLGVSRKKMFAIVCGGGFALSFIFASGAGLYILDIVDYFLNNFGLVVVGCLEAIAMGWIAGLTVYKDYANKYSYFKVGAWWNICVKFVVPVALIFNLVMTIYSVFTKGYEGYPNIALGLYGFGVILICLGLSFYMQTRPWHTPLKLNERDSLSQ